MAPVIKYLEIRDGTHWPGLEYCEEFGSRRCEGSGLSFEKEITGLCHCMGLIFLMARMRHGTCQGFMRDISAVPNLGILQRL